MTLDKVPIGIKIKIKNILDTPIKQRLLGIGLIPNSIVEVVNSSPMGDPRVYRVFNKLITLRNSEASQIEVELLEEYIPLTLAPDGEYIISNFIGGSRFLMKMRNLGLSIGTKVKILNNSLYIIKNNKHISLGHGMKEKIILRRI
ncbi:MAG: FeoA domain-containing protein [Thermosipho sp. (in: Bacteria)]|nr:FeoA domain-containing protein [Thermosipho sp. (in: thermotogales)]